MSNEKKALTRGETSRSLQAFLTANGLWGAWGQIVGIGTAVFTGYALHLGADDAFIAFFTSITYFLAAFQIIAPLLTRYIKNQKYFIVGGGFIEISLRAAPLLIPFLFPAEWRLEAFVIFVSFSLLSGYAISPFYSSWVSTVVPEQIRARFASRQTIIGTLVAMVSGFLVGQYLDLFSEINKQDGFVHLLALSLLFGWLGYAILLRAKLPATSEQTPVSPRPAMLLEPLKDPNFRHTALFYGLWTLSLGIAGPLYSVFMLRHLQISYTEISLFNGLFMLTSIIGSRLWAGLVDRFGSKPVLQILMLPATFIPLIWFFNSPESYYLVPVALVVSGILFSGISVSITPLIYGLLPTGSRRPIYLASWSVSVNLIGALGPLAGSGLALYLENVHFKLVGIPIINLHLIFLVSIIMRLIPVFLLRYVKDPKSISSRQLLNQLTRGNLLSYAYNTTIYQRTSDIDRRARATIRLGRSGNPMAITQLIHALTDASPKVRASAARALGETGAPEATQPLIQILLDGESDIRSEAAEALGHLGNDGPSIDHLIDALSDTDERVRISAIRGLASIKGEEAQELLFWHFNSDFNPRTFPTLVDALSNMRDHRIVKPALQRLSTFGSPAIRLQLLNSICRALGAGERFYHLLSYEETRRAATLSRHLRQTAEHLKSTRALPPSVRSELSPLLKTLIQAYDNTDSATMEKMIRRIVVLIRDGLAATGQPAIEILSIYLVILAVNNYLGFKARHELDDASDLFLVVCLQRMGTLIDKLD